MNVKKKLVMKIILGKKYIKSDLPSSQLFKVVVKFKLDRCLLALCRDCAGRGLPCGALPGLRPALGPGRLACRDAAAGSCCLVPPGWVWPVQSIARKLDSEEEQRSDIYSSGSSLSSRSPWPGSVWLN